MLRSERLELFRFSRGLLLNRLAGDGLAPLRYRLSHLPQERCVERRAHLRRFEQGARRRRGKVLRQLQPRGIRSARDRGRVGRGLGSRAAIGEPRLFAEQLALELMDQSGELEQVALGPGISQPPTCGQGGRKIDHRLKRHRLAGNSMLDNQEWKIDSWP